MEYDGKTQKWINKLGTMMIVYEIVLVFTLFASSWYTEGIIGVVADAVIFILFQFLNVNKTVICVLCILLGIFSIVKLAGLLVLIVAAVMIIYSIITIVKLVK